VRFLNADHTRFLLSVEVVQGKGGPLEGAVKQEEFYTLSVEATVKHGTGWVVGLGEGKVVKAE
jgi:hypothetical protein